MRLRLVGDVVFTTPAIHALRRHFPGARLDYLVEPAATAIVRHSPDLDTVIEVARPRGLARLVYDVGLARRLRRSGYDLALDFHGGPRSAWLVRASGARRRIGYDIPGRRFAYTDRVPWHPDLVPPRHSVLNQWDLLTPLGFPPVGPGGGGADIGPISAAGKVPMMAYNGDSTRYFTIHHTPADTVDRIAPEEVSKAAAAIATMTYVIADMPERLPK